VVSTKNFPLRQVVTTLLVILILGGLLAGCVVVVMNWVTVSWTDKIPPGQIEQAPLTLSPGERTDEVHAIIQPYYEEALGTLKAATRTEIAARVLAPIQRINVRADGGITPRAPSKPCPPAHAPPTEYIGICSI